MQRMLLYYVAGYVLNKEKLISEKESKPRMIINLMCVAACAVVSSVWGSQFFLAKEFAQTNLGQLINNMLKCLIAFVWIIFLFRMSKSANSKLFSYMGQYSLDLYVLQVLPVKMVGKISFFSGNWIIFYLLWVPIVSASLVLLCWFISEKILRKFKITSFLLLGK